MFPAFRERSGSTTSTSTSGRDKIPFTARTPEDESAASLLLHISSSPPVFTTARTRKNSMLERVEPMSTPMPMSIAPQPVSTDSLSWREEKEDPSLNGMVIDSNHSHPPGVVIAQTPSSMLGLDNSGSRLS